MEYLQVLGWALAGSVVSLIGGLILIKSTTKRELFVRYAMPFGAGAMLAAAFLGVLPEAIEGGGVHPTMYYALGGFLVFFILERLLGWFHHHHHDETAQGARDKTHMSLVVIGDTLHNAIDGVALGAAFLVSPAAGVGVALAIAAHEIPQEVGDFGILLGKGMRPRKVVIVNVLSALATVVTALLTFWLGGSFDLQPAPLLAIAAGFFIYVAAADIIPDIHEKPHAEGRVQALMLLVGIVVLAVVIALTPHSHNENHDEDHAGEQAVIIRLSAES
jgi:zinc and cadmium transporter